MIEGKRQFKLFEKEQQRFIASLIKEYFETARKMAKSLGPEKLIPELAKLAGKLDEKWKNYAKTRTQQTGIPVFEDAFEKNLMSEVTRITNENQRNIHNDQLRVTTNDLTDERIAEQHKPEGKTIQLNPSGAGMRHNQ